MITYEILPKYLQWMMKNWHNNFRYADDTILVADSKDKLQKIVNNVKEQSENFGLHMNVSKTKAMMVNKVGEQKNIAIDVDGQ